MKKLGFLFFFGLMANLLSGQSNYGRNHQILLLFPQQFSSLYTEFEAFLVYTSNNVEDNNFYFVSTNIDISVRHPDLSTVEFHENILVLRPFARLSNGPPVFLLSEIRIREDDIPNGNYSWGIFAGISSEQGTGVFANLYAIVGYIGGFEQGFEDMFNESIRALRQLGDN